MIKKTLVTSIIKKLSATLLGALIAFHFCILFLYQLPANPVSHRFKQDIERYISPHFSQKWSLFSPNPANSNQTIQVRFISYKNKQITISKWVDIVAPLLREKRNNFWTPTQRPLKFLNSCASNVIDLRFKIWEAEGKINNKRMDTLKILKKIDFYTGKSQGNYGILNYSKIVLNKLRPHIKRDSVFIEYKIIDAFFPRFSKRNSDYFSSRNYRFTSIYVKSQKLF